MSNAAASANKPRVKICGITMAADALAAIEFGADALGFNLYPGSRRFVQLEEVGSWIANLPDGVLKIMVLVNPSMEEALRVASLPFVSGLQLHGSETPEFCRELAERGIKFAKALPMARSAALENIPSYHSRTIVLDSAANGGQFGGSGTAFSWDLARQFVEAYRNLRVVLAGGLTPENVGTAIARARPFGVDVTTGVESNPGRKDHERMRAFLAAARGS